MPKNVNTTKGIVPATATAEQTTTAPTASETLEQGIERIRQVFRHARKIDIRIPSLDGADRLGNLIEGGVNGYMFALQRGTDVPNVPEPIIEVLRHAGIGFAELSSWKVAG